MLRDYNGNAIGHITYLGAVELTFMGILWYIGMPLVILISPSRPP